MIFAYLVNQKLALFTKLRPQCEDFQEAMVEVLASVLASPKFLYLVRAGKKGKGASRRLGGGGERRRCVLYRLCVLSALAARGDAGRGRRACQWCA